MSEAKLQEIVTKLSSLTVLEAAELSKMLEEHWGVSAAAPIAVTATAPAAAQAEEKVEFDVILIEAGAKKLDVIKRVRELCPQLTLPEAKTLVESTPKAIKQGVSKEEADKARQLLEGDGAKVEVK
jgi:large subunit ribosomal protein L7/L12